jgi:hypothetical protein
MVTQNLTNRRASDNTLVTGTLGGPGEIAYDDTLYTSVATKRKEIEDYIRFRLGDGMVDVELDPAHYKVAIDRALARYRQRGQNSEEESYAFLRLLPETQEYILPPEVQTVRQVFRRGIGSVTGTTASQFEPFASGYLNTYMLVAGRVGGLSNYELYVQYQKLAMVMFGGYMNFTFNPVSKRLVLTRKIPDAGHNYHRLDSLSSNGTAIGSTITFVTNDAGIYPQIVVGGQVVITNCPFTGYNNSYEVVSVDYTTKTFTVLAKSVLATTSVSGFDLSRTQIYSPASDDPAETVLLWLYNKKPESMILNDDRIYPWIQDYALALSKEMLGQAREKFATIAGPQGGTQLNGAALKVEAKAEMEMLEDELKRFIDGSQPYTWVTG